MSSWAWQGMEKKGRKEWSSRNQHLKCVSSTHSLSVVPTSNWPSSAASALHPSVSVWAKKTIGTIKAKPKDLPDVDADNEPE